MSVRCACRGMLAVLCCVACVATARAQRHISVGWLGNSYICDNQAGHHLNLVVADFINTAYDSGLTDVYIDTQAVSCLWAMGLAAHAGDFNSLDLIRSGVFTHVVLQGYIRTDDTAIMHSSAESNLEYAVWLAEEVRQAGAIPIIWCAHPRCDATPYMWDYSIAAYRAAADSAASPFAPVSIAWQRSLAGHPELPLYQGDCIHQNENGIFLNAAMFYQMLTGTSVVGNPVRSVGPPIHDTTALYLQQQAWAVYDSVVNGNTQPVRQDARSRPSAMRRGMVSRAVTAEGIRLLHAGESPAQHGPRIYALDGRRMAPLPSPEFMP